MDGNWTEACHLITHVGTTTTKKHPVLFNTDSSELVFAMTAQTEAVVLVRRCQESSFPLSAFDLINNSINMTTLQHCEQMLMDFPGTQALLSLFWIYYLLHSSQQVLSQQMRHGFSCPCFKIHPKVGSLWKMDQVPGNCCCQFHCRMMAVLLQHRDSVSPCMKLEYDFWEKNNFSF